MENVEEAEEFSEEISEEFAEESYESIHVKYVVSGKNVEEWDFPYSDSFFTLNEEEYSHVFAQGSLGLCLAAYRYKINELGAQQEQLQSFFQQAGFTNAQFYGYDEAPGSDTISCGIAMKVLEECTVVAVGVCGAGYGDEWMSNFKVGNQDRHVGFGEAADIVEERIEAYVQDHNLDGNLCMWISGYSRAAAVSNITAADMTNSGLFDRVYAYTYATPRTTRDKGDYKNIFNIMGVCDVVPMIPFGDWGYERYGIDLYTPAQETRSDYNYLSQWTNEVQRSLNGSRFRNLPDSNNRLRMLMQYLYSLLPTSEDYENTLQEEIRAAWGSHETSNYFVVLMKAIGTAETDTPQQDAQKTVVWEYLEELISDYLGKNMDQNWEESAGMVGNLMIEHLPTTYVNWMFCTDDESLLFSNENAYVRFVMSGNADVIVTDEEGFVMSVDSKGTIQSANATDETRPSLYAIRKGEQTIITLPKDKEYQLSINSLAKDTIAYMGIQYTTGGVDADIDSVSFINAEKGKTYTVVSFEYEEDAAILEGESDMILSLGSLLESFGFKSALIKYIESYEVDYLSLTEIFLALIGLALFLAIAFLICVILWIRRLIMHKKRSFLPTLILQGILMLVFVFLEACAHNLMPAVPVVELAFRILALLPSIVISIDGLFAVRIKKNAVVGGGLLLCIAADIVMCYYSAKHGITIAMSYSVILILLLAIILILRFKNTPLHVGTVLVLISEIGFSLFYAFDLGQVFRTIVLVIHYAGILCTAAAIWFAIERKTRNGLSEEEHIEGATQN